MIPPFFVSRFIFYFCFSFMFFPSFSFNGFTVVMIARNSESSLFISATSLRSKGESELKRAHLHELSSLSLDCLSLYSFRKGPPSNLGANRGVLFPLLCTRAAMGGFHLIIRFRMLSAISLTFSSASYAEFQSKETALQRTHL